MGFSGLPHTPNYLNLKFIALVVLVLFVLFFFNQKLVLDDESISFYKNRKFKTSIPWQDVETIELHKDVLFFPISVIITNKQGRHKNIVVFGYFQNMEKLYKQIKDRTPNQHIEPLNLNHSFQRKVSFWMNAGYYLSIGSFIFWLIMSQFNPNLYLFMPNIERPFILGLYLPLLFLILTYFITHFVLSTHPFKSMIRSAVFCVSCGLVFLATAISTLINTYDDYCISHNKLPTKTITAKLIEKKKKNNNQIQIWKIGNNEPEVVLNGWQGINHSLQVNSTYKLPVYEGNLDYLVITKEQFMQATK